MEAIWKPFLDEIKNSGRQFTFEKEPRIKSFEARRMWDPEFFRKYAPSALFSDSAPKNRFCWAHDRVEVGRYWYGFDSVWLPETLLAKEQQEEFALHSASRHRPFEVQFSKGLAGQEKVRSDRPILCPSRRRKRRVERRWIHPQELTRCASREPSDTVLTSQLVKAGDQLFAPSSVENRKPLVIPWSPRWRSKVSLTPAAQKQAIEMMDTGGQTQSEVAEFYNVPWLPAAR
jgi:hypothetical protein